MTTKTMRMMALANANTMTTIKYGAAQIMEIGVCYSDIVVTPSVFCVCHAMASCRIVLHMYVFRAARSLDLMCFEAREGMPRQGKNR